MKISCIQENLHKGLQTVGHVAGRDSGLPILSNVLLKAEKGLFILSATNLEIGIQTSVRAKVEEEGELAVDAKVLADFVGVLPRERIDIALKGADSLSVSCGTYATTIKGVVADDYPIIPTIPRDNVVAVNINNFKRALQRTVIATKFDESRPELSGVFFHFSIEGSLTLAATDAYRLAETKVKCESAPAQETKLIVPIRTVQELLRILGDDLKETCQIFFSETQVLFVVDTVELISKVIEGEYPDYTQIIPSSFATTCTVERTELVRAVKASSIFSKSGLNDVTLTFSSGEKTGLSVRSANSTVGESETTLSADITGSGTTLCVNYRYLLDGLQNMQSDKIVLSAIDTNSPCVIKPEKDEGYVYMVMPIRD